MQSKPQANPETEFKNTYGSVEDNSLQVENVLHNFGCRFGHMRIHDLHPWHYSVTLQFIRLI